MGVGGEDIIALTIYVTRWECFCVKITISVVCAYYQNAIDICGYTELLAPCFLNFSLYTKL